MWSDDLYLKLVFKEICECVIHPEVRLGTRRDINTQETSN